MSSNPKPGTPEGSGSPSLPGFPDELEVHKIGPCEFQIRSKTKGVIGSGAEGSFFDHALSAEMVRRWKAHEDLVTALEAVEARSTGNWQSVALKQFGELSSDKTSDILGIVRPALAAAKGEKQ